MKKIKEFLRNKNIIIIMCVIVILGLSISLVISLNDDNNKTNTSNNNTETNIENKDENLSEVIEDENKDDENKDDENKENENKGAVDSNNNKPSSSSNSQKNESQTNNSSSNKKENENQNNNTSSNSQKNDTTTSSQEDIVYLCPSGYTQSKDKKTCTKIIELEQGYICQDGYEQSDDKKTCTKELLADIIITEHCDCDNVPIDGYHAWDNYYDEKTGTCYCISGTSSSDYVKEQCFGGITKNWSEEFGFCYMGTTTKRKKMKSCPDGYNYKNDTQCYKIDKRNAVYTSYCPNDYIMSDDKQSCKKTINATKQ